MSATTSDADGSAPPASGAWRPGDPPGRRRFARLFTDAPLPLELRGSLGPLDVAYETWGEPDATRSNGVLVCHALTGDSHAAGPEQPGHPSPGWWDGLIGPGRALDTRRFWVVCANVLGGCQGTTGPASLAEDGRPWGSRWPRTTVRDQAAVEVALSDALGVDRWALVVGGSMGGMRVLEWAVGWPERVRAAAPIGCGAASSAEQIALQTVQMEAITGDPRWRGGDYHDAAPGEGPHHGLGVARRLAQVTYRSEAELAERFGRAPQTGEDPLADGRYAVQSYLDHHADKLARRFDAGTYVALTQAMNDHDVGRGRGGVEAALAGVAAPTLVVGIDSDRLYPLHQQRELAEAIPDAELAVLTSIHGHDGFLIDTDQLGDLLRPVLAAGAEP